MARRKVEPQPKRGMTVFKAVHELRKVEHSLNAFCATSPRTVAALGGREAVLRMCEMTCIGPVPRLDEQTWEQMSWEHVDARSRYGVTKPGKGAEGPNPLTGRDAPAGGPGFGGVP